MSNGENHSNGPQFRMAPLITSASMVGGGTLIVLAGLAIGGGHLVSAEISGSMTMTPVSPSMTLMLERS